MQNYLNDLSVLVLDSWPVVEWLKGHQPSLARFRALLERAQAGEVVLLMSTISLGEILYVSQKFWNARRAEEILLEVKSLPIDFIHPGLDDILRAARLKGRFAVSYADCFPATLAIERGAKVLTGDRDFLHLARADVVAVEWWGL